MREEMTLERVGHEDNGGQERRQAELGIGEE